ncbi:MAG TPA: radical SAM protein [Chloroflexi bacterium]|nr:radical SAM protein [Chloroflexota bacterium]
MHVLSLPAIYALELTPACNNRCIGCSNVYASRRAKYPPMSAGQWRDLLAPFISEAVQIRLTGGEPTLHPGFFQILEYVASHTAWVTIFTNGRWLDAQQFVERMQGQSKVTGLLVSLHGADPTSHERFTGCPGSFEETLSNIRLAIAHGITVALNTVITRHSWHQIEEIVALGQSLGVQHMAFSRYIGPPLPIIEPTQSQLQAAFRQIQGLMRAGIPVTYGISVPQCFMPNDSEGCLAGVAYLSIDPWGNVRPCAHSPTVIGSLHKKSLAELWHSTEMDAWRALVPSECTTCAAYSVCHGGCRAIQELRPEGRDPLRGSPLTEFIPHQTIRELPSDVRPRAMLRMRPEPFGYALLGQGRIVPVHADARPLIEACNGQATFAELVSRFGPGGLDLLGELWDSGLLEAA